VLLLLLLGWWSGGVVVNLTYSICTMCRYTPEGINKFCEIVGVTRSRNIQDMGLLEECCRHDLEDRVNREMAVIHPLRVTLVNYPENKVEFRKVNNNNNSISIIS